MNINYRDRLTDKSCGETVMIMSFPRRAWADEV
jgi:hypothetical protein